jgi:two-component system, cell cycle sensor histidine kinase and response regulator CckA
VRLFWKMYFSIMISLLIALAFSAAVMNLREAIGDKLAAWLGFLMREASEKRGEIVLPVVLFLVTALVILGIILYFSGKYFKKPVRELIGGAHRVAQGDLAYRVPTDREGEVGLLAQAFNSMAEELEKRTTSKAYVDSILDSALDALIIVGSDMRILWTNKGTTNLLGYTEAELAGRSIGMILGSGQDGPLESARLTRLIERGMAKNHEIFVEARDTKRIPVLVNCSMIRDKDGNTDSYVCAIRDIASLKVAEDALCEERERFMILSERAPLGMALIDRSGNYKYVNPKFREIFGYSMDDVPTEQAWFRAVFPDPKHRYSAIKTWEEDLERTVPGEKVAKTYTITSRDGTEKTIETINVMLNEGERLITYEDITERKRTEEALKKTGEKYRRIFEDALEGIFQATLDGRLISANPALARLFGYDSPDELVRDVNDMWQLLFPDPLKQHEFTLNVLEKGAVRSQELQALRRDGGLAWFSMDAHIVRDKGGKPLYCEAVLGDAGDRKKLEAELRQAHKMEAIGTLAGGIAHDFNNLLMGIQGYVSLILLNKDPNHPDYAKLKTIEQQIQNGATLTKQLLGFARKGKYELKPIDLNEVAERTSIMVGRTRKEVTIETRFQKGLRMVEADQGQIEQMLINLYLNACQAMPDGGTLYLETTNISVAEGQGKVLELKPGDFVRITVTDTGVGMDERTRQRIFEPFFTTKEMGHGTGLGLATVYGIVEGHGGVINVRSEKGQGTTFTIYLPATTREAVKEETRSSEVPKGRGTILLVDDEDVVIDVCRQLLDSLGYHIVVARSGYEAVTIYKEQVSRIDAIILDMVMPDMSGSETFDALRAINKDARIVLSSGYSLNGLATRIMERGCKAFIQKPFGIDQLSQTLKKVLNT